MPVEYVFQIILREMPTKEHFLKLEANLAPSCVRCGDLHGNSNPQTLDSSLRGAAFSSSRVSRP
ncbi:unnamed protein product, partial [Coccothraustes coccothraustes]